MKTAAGFGIGDDRLKTLTGLFQVMKDPDGVSEIETFAGKGGQVGLDQVVALVARGFHVLSGRDNR